MTKFVERQPANGETVGPSLVSIWDLFCACGLIVIDVNWALCMLPPASLRCPTWFELSRWQKNIFGLKRMFSLMRFWCWLNTKIQMAIWDSIGHLNFCDTPDFFKKSPETKCIRYFGFVFLWTLFWRLCTMNCNQIVFKLQQLNTKTWNHEHLRKSQIKIIQLSVRWHNNDQRRKS